MPEADEHLHVKVRHLVVADVHERRGVRRCDRVRFRIEGLSVEVACRVLGVSCAGFYAWRSRSPSARAVRHAWLTDVIREVHAASDGSYGAKRVYAELVLGRGIRVCHNDVLRSLQS